MTKKKAPKTPRTLSKTQTFFMGIIVGLCLWTLPLDVDFAKVELKELNFPSSASLFTKYLPITTPLLHKEGFSIAYNGQTRNPQWVYHQLTAATLEKKLSREDCEFKEELLLPEHIRASKTDYQGSGFDRGHLCPAADCPTQKALDDSFSLSNIAPQTPAFNRGYWKKLETHARELTTTNQAVHLFTGPLYLSTSQKNGKNFVTYQVLGKRKVAVPTHFFMLIFVENPNNKLKAKGYILPNQPIESSTPLKKFAASLEEIESSSGVLFTHFMKER